MDYLVQYSILEQSYWKRVFEGEVFPQRLKLLHADVHKLLIFLMSSWSIHPGLSPIRVLLTAAGAPIARPARRVCCFPEMAGTKLLFALLVISAADRSACRNASNNFARNGSRGGQSNGGFCITR
jgi:hypothetical protein